MQRSKRITEGAARFTRYWNLVIKLKRHAKKHGWSERKRRYWLSFITPQTPFIRWTEARRGNYIPYGPLTSHCNPHTGEHSSHTL